MEHICTDSTISLLLFISHQQQKLFDSTMFEHSSTTASPSSLFPQLTQFDTLSQLNHSDTGYCYYNNSSSNCSSGYSSYGGSPTSVPTPNFMQRSVSSNSFTYNNNGTHHPLSALFAELLDSHDAPVRRVCSTGDLQVHLHTFFFLLHFMHSLTCCADQESLQTG